MDPARLLHPRSIAVVGATERAGSYGGEALLNLRRLEFPGNVYGVNPGREQVHGFPCVPTVADLPEAVDAVVVAIPAAAAPARGRGDRRTRLRRRRRVRRRLRGVGRRRRAAGRARRGSARA